MKKCFKYRYGLLQIFFFVGFGLGQTAMANPALGIDSSKKPSENTGNSCFTDTIQVPTSKAQAVDVLFVVETSPSMNDIRQKIIDGISAFVSGLPVNSDFNIAVMLSHGSTSNLSGKLYQMGAEPLVLKYSQLTNGQIQTYLDAKFNLLPVDIASGGGEEGMFSLFRGITSPAQLAEIQAADFFRANAALSVVFIADRRDICASIPVGVPQETDPAKIVARVRDCEGLTAAGLTNRLALLKGPKPILVTGMIYTDLAAPAGKEIGYGYRDMISLNNSSAIDIAHDNISAGLAPIMALGGQTSGQTTFQLNYANIDSTTLKATINGEDIPFTYDGSKITTTRPVAEGATIVISYCLDADNPYAGECKVFENADQWDHWIPAPSTVDLALINKSGNISIGAVRNLLVKNRSGKLSVQSAMAISSISSVFGNSYFRLTGDINAINDVGGSFRIDKAGNVGNVSYSKGGFHLNALTVATYTNASGNACIRARSIGKIQSMNGTKTFIASEIEELSVIKGTVHVYGAIIKSVTNNRDKICLHNGAKVLNSSNVSGFIGKCP